MAPPKELEIDVTYEDEEEDTAVMPLGTIRELLLQEARVSSAAGRPSLRWQEPLFRKPEPRKPEPTPRLSPPPLRRPEPPLRKQESSLKRR